MIITLRFSRALTAIAITRKIHKCPGLPWIVQGWSRVVVRVVCVCVCGGGGGRRVIFSIHVIS